MLSKRPSAQLLPSTIVAVLFIGAMTVTSLAGSGLGAVRTNCSMCSFTCLERSTHDIANARSPGGPINPRISTTVSRAKDLVQTQGSKAAWKILNLPPPAL